MRLRVFALGLPCGVERTRSLAEETIYSFADGVVLSIRNAGADLVNLKNDSQVNIEPRHVEAIERVTFGTNLVGFEEHIPVLLNEGLIVEGPPRADAWLRARLALLDSMYMDAYRHRLSDREKRAYDCLLVAHSYRKRFFESVGQCPVLPETALRRAMLVGDAERVGKKKVLCIGDDDFLSVGLTALGHEVTVFDIDEHLLKFIKDVGSSMDLAIETVERDLRDPLDAHDDAEFDVFLTDPMSNRDCFELFLSRGLALLRPEGVGYTAVFPPTYRLFVEIGKEMGFDEVQRYARHNHYYSKYMGLHHYESDWLQIRQTPGKAIKHPPEPFTTHLNLYREDYYRRSSNVTTFIDNIEDSKFVQPMYLDMILDRLESLDGVEVFDRIKYLEHDQTLIHCPTARGYLTLYVDRAARQVFVDMFPMVAFVEEALRDMLLASCKTNIEDTRVSVSIGTWEVRVL